MKKTCPNGHVYDSNIYGDTCPLCPSSASPAGGGLSSNPTMMATDGYEQSAHTRVAAPSPMAQQPMIPQQSTPMQNDPTGPTQVRQGLQQAATNKPASEGSRTVIRRPATATSSAAAQTEGRKLVGFLVTYNRHPMGKAFNIYEGRNYIGRDASCDVSVPDDNQMSGRHMLIRYLSGNKKFSFRDEMSSNGTYINKQLMDEGELQNYDIIRVGSTLFIFISIPQI